MNVTEIVARRFGDRGFSSEWAAAVAHHAGAEGLKAHVSQFLDEMGAQYRLYGLIVREALEEVDYEELARSLKAAWPELEEGEDDEDMGG